MEGHAGVAWGLATRIGLALALFSTAARGAEPADGAAPARHLFDGRLAPEVRPSLEATLEIARAKLARRDCQAVLHDFRDAAGRPLAENLAGGDDAAGSFLGSLYFTTGRNTRLCQRSLTLAFTEPGSHVVYVCEPRFLAVQRFDEERAAHALIHEALHSLGLGENPPSSEEITAAVARRCGS